MCYFEKEIQYHMKKIVESYYLFDISAIKCHFY